jgi:hypothetical protein
MAHLSFVGWLGKAGRRGAQRRGPLAGDQPGSCGVVIELVNRVARALARLRVGSWMLIGSCRARGTEVAQ